MALDRMVDRCVQALLVVGWVLLGDNLHGHSGSNYARKHLSELFSPLQGRYNDRGIGG